jgi:hypothetical protein
MGEFCQLAPVYNLSGAADDSYNGMYERLEVDCTGMPVYQLEHSHSRSGDRVLYQPWDAPGQWCISLFHFHA